MTIDLAIVGGGIAGHMVAAQVAMAVPRAGIVLIERDLPGAGASARSAGAHFPLGYTDATRAMSRESQRFYETAQAPVLPFRMLPMRVHCARDRADWARGLFTEGADLRAAENALPGLASWNVTGAHQADVSTVVETLRRALPERVTALNGIQVVALTEQAGGVQIAMSDGQFIQAGRVVLAPGPWALAPEFAALTEPLGLRIKKVVAFEVAEQDRESLDLFLEEDAFLMPHPTGSGTLFSYTSPTWDADPATVGCGATAGDRAAAKAVLARVAPHLQGSLRGARVFCDTYSPDRIPVVRTVGRSGRIVFTGGANGSGYRLAPAMAARTLEQLGMQHEEEMA